MLEPVFTQFIDSPVGPLMLAVNRSGALVCIYFLETGPPERGLEWLAKHGFAAEQDPAPLTEVRRQLDDYFAGRLERFELALAPKGTPFQQSVWQYLLTIPYGTCTTYGAMAAALGNPAASRAVGLANGSNPIPIVIPCHRVIGSNGKLTGFGGGLPAKHKLLTIEGYYLPLR